RAEELLRDCPADLRGWEWRYLRRQCDTSLLTLRGHEQTLNAVAYSHNGRRLLTAGQDRKARLWDALTGSELRSFTGEQCWSVAFSPDPDGRYVATGYGSADERQPAQLKVWDADTGKEFRTFPGHHGIVAGVAFRPGGRWLASAGSDGAVR